MKTKFVEMSDQDFSEWRQRSIAGYAQEKVKAGNFAREGATEAAEKELSQLLPDGKRTKDNHFHTVIDDDTKQKVGMIWFVVNPPDSAPNTAFILDLFIQEQFRRRGYASSALLLLESEVKKYHCDTIALHVFGHNFEARKLYERMGYVPTNIRLSKKVTY